MIDGSGADDKRQERAARRRDARLVACIVALALLSLGVGYALEASDEADAEEGLG